MKRILWLAALSALAVSASACSAGTGENIVTPTDITLSRGQCTIDLDARTASLNLTLKSKSSYALVSLSGNLVDETKAVVGQGAATLQNVVPFVVYQTKIDYSVDGTPQGTISCTAQIDSAIMDHESPVKPSVSATVEPKPPTST